MIKYEKAEFTAAYAVSLRYPNGIRLQNYKGPEFPGTLEGTAPPVTVRLHYHPLVQRPAAVQRLASILDRHTITAADRVLVFGCGFGWLAEVLTDQIGCKAVGIDLSQYVQDMKDTSANDELSEAIQASGLEPTTGHGLKIMQDFSDSGPRTRATVLQGDMQNKGVRNAVKRELGGDPTVVITEEVWQLLTAQEQNTYTGVFSTLGAAVAHVIDGVVI